MKTHIPRLKPKVIKYRSYKKFDPASFLQNVKNTDFKVDSNDTDLSYRNLSSAFRKLVDKHAPLKTRVQRGNTAPFMNLQLQKAIYARSRLKKKFNKNSSTENRIKFKKQQNKCVSIRKKAMKSHISFHMCFSQVNELDPVCCNLNCILVVSYLNITLVSHIY